MEHNALEKIQNSFRNILQSMVIPRRRPYLIVSFFTRLFQEDIFCKIFSDTGLSSIKTKQITANELLSQ